MSTSKRSRQWLVILTFSICISIAVLFVYSFNTYAYSRKSGVVTGDNVNVRTGPGTTYSKLVSAGANVQLSKNFEVTVIDEAKASDGAKWYKITFAYKNTELTGYIHGDYVKVEEAVEYVPDADFEKYLTEQGFPDSYKDSLRELHAKYPKWVFVADKINYNWSDVLSNESENDKVIGRSLVSVNSISSWKSTDPRAYNWDTGKWYGYDGASWVVASKELVAYYLDPRNFLDEQGIFQFECLGYDPAIHTNAGIKAVIKGSFMEGAKVSSSMTYATALMNAGKASGVSPYNLAVRIIQEQGINGTGRSISGTVSGYEGYYNYFNIGAYAAGGRSAVVNGLIYAKSRSGSPSYGRPWNTRYKSILGGGEYLGKGYITQGQDTLYYQKFDLVGTPYTHQYMTGIQAPSSEGKRMSGAYSASMKADTALVFRIPVYKSMPAKACQCPTGNGSPNNALDSLKVEGYSLTPSFNKFVYEYDLIVKNNVTSVNLTATPLDSTATITGIGKKNLNEGVNKFTVKVKAENGLVREYKVTVARQDVNGNIPNKVTDESDTGSAKPSMSSKYKINGAVISGVNPGTSVKTALRKFTVSDGTGKICDGNNNVLPDKAIVSTGCRYLLYDSRGKKYKIYKFVIYGDVSGDGKIDIKDLLYVKMNVLGKMKLAGAKLEAANVSRKDDEVDIKDLLYVKLHILEKKKIVQ